MNSNFILVKDDVLSLKECNELIKIYKKNLKLNKILDYFTHTHKGQPDLKKERSIITGYYSFCQQGVNEISEF